MPRSRRILAFSLITLAALGLRIYMLLGPLNPIEADQAIVGIMAMHILEGDRPFFFYGQSYYGPLDAYITAPLIAIFGVNRMVIRVAAVLFSLIFVWVSYLVGKRFFSESVGWYCALYAALPPFMLMFRGLMADADYIMLLIAGSLSLLQFQSWLLNPSLVKLLALAFLVALGSWFHPVMGYYLLAMITVWIVQKMGNLRIGNQGMRQILPVLGLWIRDPLAGLSAIGYLQIIALVTFPVILGFFVPPPYADKNLDAHLTLQGTILDTLAVILSCVVLLIVSRVGLKLVRQGKALLPVFAFFTVFVFTVFSIFIKVKVDSLTLPRYLMPIYSAIPLGVYALFDFTHKRVWLRPVILCGLLAVNIYGDVTMKPAHAPYALLEWLVKRDGVSYVYTDYWTGYWLAFESREQVIPAIFDENNRPGENRYPKYREQVMASESPLYIYQEGNPNQLEFQAFLDAENAEYSRQTVDKYVVYTDLSIPVTYPLR